MQVIYIDVLFVINLIINYLILITTAKFGGFMAKRKRILLGATIGAVYSVVMFFPTMSFMYSMWIKCLFALFLSGISYGFANPIRLFRRAIMIVVVSLTFGGGMLIMESTFSEAFDIKNGIPYMNISLKTLIIVSLLCYAIMGLIFKGSAKKGEKCIRKLNILLGDKKIDIKALIDTGCELRDPISGKPVIVCEKDVAISLLNDNIRNEFLNSCKISTADTMQKIINYRGGERFRIVPFKTVGNTDKIMLSFRPDMVTLENGNQLDVLIGISDVRFSSECGYSALMGTQCQ